ncbi:MAG: TRAM domain-containing protein [Deltaproteobacteria bacterium]|nr:MAG: TRAM domain-containing protein [Deltaproteobacteria bacterium]
MNQSRVGKVEEVLVENEAMESHNSGVFGRTAQGILMNFPGDASLVGAIVKTEVTEATAFLLKGRIL